MKEEDVTSSLVNDNDEHIIEVSTTSKPSTTSLATSEVPIGGPCQEV